MSDIIQRDENTELVRDENGKLRRRTHPHITQGYDNRRAIYDAKIDDLARGLMDWTPGDTNEGET